MVYGKSFDFDQGTLGRNLATLDENMRDFLDTDIDVHTAQAEASMKTEAPWRNRTGHARATLWATNDKKSNRYSITLGHGAEYGVYLEESNDGKFQIIMPTLLATARSFMRSLEHAFAQVQTHTIVSPAITPGVGTRPGTSQGARERAVGAKTGTRPDNRVSLDKRGRLIAKDVKGRFVSLKKVVNDATKRTRRTKRR